MLLIDSNVMFKPLPEPRYCDAQAERLDGFAGVITNFQQDWSFRTGRWAQTDFDFEAPSKNLLAAEATLLTFPNAKKFERFDYPGGYTDREAGKQLTRTLIEAEEAQYHVARGCSSSAALAPGSTFTLASRSNGDGEAYAILAVTHDARDSSYFTGPQEEAFYRNNFEAIRASVPYRPQRLAAKPVVQGPQTATVVGPGGEAIYTDKHGRIKVQFHWDRYGKRDADSSCWVRVSQNWAGKGWGGAFIPHVGQEVVVSFLEGDPDRPLVTGRVYNASNMGANALPSNKTQSAIRDHTGNEILMEGKGGSQDIRVTAVKDMHLKVVHDRDKNVGNNETTHVKVDRTETVGGNETITVTGNRSEKVAGNETIEITGKRSEDVGGDETITIKGARTETVKRSETVTVLLARTHTIGLAETQTVGGMRSVSVTLSNSLSVSGSDSVSVGRSQKISVKSKRDLSVGSDSAVSVGGNRQVKVKGDDALSVGKSLTIEAETEIVLKTGSASITMRKNGDITIEGKKLTIKGSGDVIIKGQKIHQN